MMKDSLMAVCFGKSVKVFNQNVEHEMTLSERAVCIMECVENKVSPVLYEKLTEMLLGYEPETQVVMARNLLAFALRHVAHQTGYVPVDTVLQICYVWIGTEQGLAKKKFTNALIDSTVIDKQTVKMAKKAMKAKQHVEPKVVMDKEYVKVARCHEVLRGCCSCKYRCVDTENGRTCMKTGMLVESSDVCPDWKMDRHFQKVGNCQGRFHSKAYQAYVMEQRLREDEGIELGVMEEEERKPIEEIRQEFMEKYGSIYES